MRITAWIVRCGTATAWTVFAVLAFHAFWVNVTRPQWAFSGAFYPWLIAILGFSVIYLTILYRTKRDSRIHLIALLFIAVTLVCRTLWVRYFDAQQVSDFLTYWDVGRSIVVDGVAAQSALLALSDLPGVYFLRSIFYTAPIQYIFGDSQQWLEIVNVFLVTLAMLVFYDFGRRLFSPRVAAGALLLFFWNPDIWYGVTLANHDIVFLPGFAGLCWVVHRLDTKLHDRRFVLAPAVLLSVAVGLLIFVLDVQRGFGRPSWVALILLLAYYLYDHHRQRIASLADGIRLACTPSKDLLRKGVLFLLVLLLIPLGMYELCRSAFVRSTGIWSESDYVTYFSAKDVLGSDRWAEMRLWRTEYSPQLPEDIRTEFSVRKLTSEFFTDPAETGRHLLRKNAVLADPGGTLGFSSRPAIDPWVGRTNSETVPMQRELHQLLAAILFFLLFLRLLLHPLFPLRRGVFFLVFFTAFFYLLILLFSEAQPRYNLFTVFLTSLMVAQLLLGQSSLKNVKWWQLLKASTSADLEREITDGNN